MGASATESLAMATITLLFFSLFAHDRSGRAHFCYRVHRGLALSVRRGGCAILLGVGAAEGEGDRDGERNVDGLGRRRGLAPRVVLRLDFT